MDLIEKLNNLGIDKNNLIDKWDLLKESNLSVEQPALKENAINLIDTYQETLFENKPILGAEKWHVIDVIFLKNNYFAVLLEDGHIMNCAIFKYERELEDFTKILEFED